MTAKKLFLDDMLRCLADISRMRSCVTPDDVAGACDSIDRITTILVSVIDALIELNKEAS